MAKKYELTPRAERDLKDIWLYTAEAWGDKQAKKYVALLEKRFEVLADSPYVGGARPDIEKGYKCFPEEKQLVFYRLEEDTVVILAVPHISMDIERPTEWEKEKDQEQNHER